jgi:hypothetical protein
VEEGFEASGLEAEVLEALPAEVVDDDEDAWLTLAV